MAKTTPPEQKTGTNPKSGKHKGLYVALGVVVFALTFLVYMALSNEQPAPETSTTFNEVPTTATEKSYAYQLNGDFNQAYKVLDEAIASTSSDREKASLYNEKSIAALNAQDYPLALAMAMESEKRNPTVSSAHIIAESSERMGDKKTAAEFIKKQINRITSSGTPYIREDIDALTEKLKQLESGNE